MPNSPQQVFFARQPVFDADLELVAWEIRYSGGPRDPSPELDPEQAAARLLVHLFSDFDLAPLLENKQALVRFPLTTLREPPDFHRDRFIIELDGSAENAADMLEPALRLWGSGHRMCIDRYHPDSPLAELAPKMQFLRLDTQSLGEPGVRRVIGDLNGYFGRIIAGDIETQEQFRACREAGAHLFQGNFLCEPRLESGAHLPESKLVVLRLLDRVRDDDCSIEEAQALLSKDAKLGYRLLRLVNSAQFRRSAEIRSLQHALTVLGLEKLRTWITMIALCNLSDAPATLQVTGLFRARMCEQLGIRLGHEEPDLLFTAGLFSLLPAFFDRPMAELLDHIHVSATLRSALEGGDNPEGQLLRFVLGYESAEWEEGAWQMFTAAGVEAGDIGAAYAEATKWSIATLRELMRG